MKTFDNKNLIIFGNNVKNYRLLKGITQEQLAETIAISSIQLGRIESGKNACSINMLLKLCYSLNITPNDLFKDVDGIPISSDSNVFLNGFINSHELRSDETKQLLQHIINFFPPKEHKKK